MGFVSVKELSGCETADFEIEEFFILRNYRKKGIGKNIATKMFADFKGKWQIRVLDNNAPAMVFWQRVISEYTDDKYSKESIVHNCEYSGEWKMELFNFEN